MPEFYRERHVKAARKAHRCVSCDHKIDQGESYLYISATDYEGDFCTAHYHHDCRKAEVWFNDSVFDWLALSEVEWEFEPASDELCSLFPAVAARLGLLDA